MSYSRPSAPVSHANEAEHRRQLANTINLINQSTPDYRRTDSEISAGVTPVDQRFPELDVRRYGAVGDNSTDCLDAFNAAFAVAVQKASNGHGAEIFIPEGRFRLSDEWDVFRPSSPRRDITIRGVDQLSSVIVANFYGAGKGLIRCVDPNGVARSSPLSIRDLGFANVSTSGGVNPVFVRIHNWGESRMDRVRFASSNNSHVQVTSSQNIRMTDVVGFFGGRHFPYKATSGITFAVDSGTKTITASADIFDPGDVGKFFFIFPSNVSRRIRYTIDSVLSGTEATYREDFGLTETSAAGHFEPARCSMTSGSAVLTANADCFTEDMVGLVVYVRGARSGAWGAALLRGEIVEVTSANTVVLSVAASRTVSDEYFGVASFDMGLPPGQAGSSDVKIDKLHIEHYRGIGFVAQNTDAYQISGKIHGETQPTDSAKSDAACWLDDFEGTWRVELDSSCSMADTRIYACNFNGTTTFDLLHSRHILNGIVAATDLFENQTGYLVIRGLLMSDDVADPRDLVIDANYVADPSDPRIIYEGTVNMVSATQKARLYLGPNMFATPPGSLALRDGITAPGQISGYAQIFVDGSDGALKVIFGDGTVKTIVTDS